MKFAEALNEKINQLVKDELENLDWDEVLENVAQSLIERHIGELQCEVEAQLRSEAVANICYETEIDNTIDEALKEVEW